MYIGYVSTGTEGLERPSTEVGMRAMVDNARRERTSGPRTYAVHVHINDVKNGVSKFG
jgi:hypothetical protein